MGICGSKGFELNPTKPGHDDIAFEVFGKLGLSNKEVNKLYKSFIAMDQDDSLYLHPAEIYAFLHMEPNALNQRMFAAFDLDHSGRLNFLEYVCAMWNFLSMDPSLLGSFAFTIFDSDGSNSLDFKEVKRLVEMIHHKKYEHNDGVRNLVEALKDISHSLNIEQFSRFSRENPNLCAPLIQLQFNLRKQIIGDSFWTSLADRRYHNTAQNSVTYTAEVCGLVMKKYEHKKHQEKITKLQMERQQSLKRIASHNASIADVSKQRNSRLLSFFKLAGDKESAALPVTEPKNRVKVEKKVKVDKSRIMAVDEKHAAELLVDGEGGELEYEIEHDPEFSRHAPVSSKSSKSRPTSARKKSSATAGDSAGSEKKRRSSTIRPQREDGGEEGKKLKRKSSKSNLTDEAGHSDKKKKARPSSARKQSMYSPRGESGGDAGKLKRTKSKSSFDISPAERGGVEGEGGERALVRQKSRSTIAETSSSEHGENVKNPLRRPSSAQRRKSRSEVGRSVSADQAEGERPSIRRKSSRSGAMSDSGEMIDKRRRPTSARRSSRISSEDDQHKKPRKLEPLAVDTASGDKKKMKPSSGEKKKKKSRRPPPISP